MGDTAANTGTGLSYTVANMQGLGQRERQEDAFAFCNATDPAKIAGEGLFAVVCDGMGGMADGKEASERAIDILVSDFKSTTREGDLPAQMERSLRNACVGVYGLIGGMGGSTAVVCIFFLNKLYYVGVGDSFVYLLRDGQLLRINKEHNIRNAIYLRGIRDGSMDYEEARNDFEEAALTEFLGMPELDEVDVLRRGLPLDTGDMVLMCSDGVGGVLDEKEIIECMEGRTPEEACAMIKEAVLRANRPGQDNFTALVISCGQ